MNMYMQHMYEYLVDNMLMQKYALLHVYINLFKHKYIT